MNLKLGDKVTVKLPSGAIIKDGEISDISDIASKRLCEVCFLAGNSCFFIRVSNLLPPF